ncbi:MFS transporter, partial [Streptomyces nitrosporeus]|uniref:MFS transporter n=1 Tax=Streptomyces nitrosporeus TaxID=28894 RepID=UPI001E612A5B
LLGRRRVFLVALAVFAAASLAGGLVDDGGLLIAARFLKGVSAAFTAPAGLSIITTTFAEGPARNRALSIYTTCAASGFSLGLVLSDRGCTVSRYEPRPDGTPSKLSTVDRRFTARTRISASHRQELKDRIEAAWRLRGYQQKPPTWTLSSPDEGPDYLSAATSEGIA